MAQSTRMLPRAALVTVTLSDYDRWLWRRYCRPTWAAYAERHGYAVLCLTESLEAAAPFEQLVWLDPAVLIRPDAPALTAGVPPERVGAVAVSGEEQSPAVRPGVWLFSPRHHRALFEQLYASQPASTSALPDVFSAERVQWLDPRFNVWLDAPRPEPPDQARLRATVEAAFAHSYCLNLAGYRNTLPTLTPLAARHIHSLTRPAAPAPLSTPVALFLFNRPETTAQVFAAIRAARPATLLLVADGPRAAVSTDAQRVAAARAVVAQVDWPCDVRTHYADENMGLKRRFDSGLDWVFTQVERAIILEDDCLPSPDFFAFCAELLERYASDERILSISGDNFQLDDPPGGASYYCSRYPYIWGWATWRRAWRQHDPTMAAWPTARAAGWLDTRFTDPAARRYWDYLFQTAYEAHHTWDYPWTFSSWRLGALHLHPAANLVTNIGFGGQGTHATPANSLLADLPTEPFTWPLTHPAQVERWAAGDDYAERTQFSGTLARAFQTARARLRRRSESGA